VNRTSVGRDSANPGLRQVIAVLRGLLAQLEVSDEQLAPWQAARPLRPVFEGRLSATDQLSWWFRPANAGDDFGDSWDSYFSEEPANGADLGAAPKENDWLPGVSGHAATVPFRDPVLRDLVLSDPVRRASPTTARARLRSLLAEPEEELLDSDAEAVVSCLYDFVHAIGRDDLDGAMSCVAPGYHALEDDREVDHDGLTRRVKALLDSLHGWEKEVFLVEVPQPVLHPAAILVHVEMQINARHRVTQERRTILDRRIAVFERQPNRTWRIAALSPV
jgi:hypothetical protein